MSRRQTNVIPFVVAFSVACSRHPEPTSSLASNAKITADDSTHHKSPSAGAAETAIDSGAGALEWTKVEPVGDLAATLRLEAKATYAKGKRPILMVTAPWCSVCKTLKAALLEGRSNPKWAKIRLLEVDGDVYTERLQTMGLKVAFLPTLARFTPQGTLEDEVAKPKDGVEGLLRTLDTWTQK